MFTLHVSPDCFTQKSLFLLSVVYALPVRFSSFIRVPVREAAIPLVNVEKVLFTLLSQYENCDN